MPSWIKLFGGWALAALIAVAFSWGAVAQVRNRVIQPSIEIPTTVALQSESADTTSTTTSSPPPVIRVEPELIEETTTSAAQPDSTTTSTATPAEPTAPSAGTTPTTTAPPVATTTTTSPPATTQPPVSTTTTTTTAPPPVTETSSYQLTGGVVTIAHSPGVVTFVSAIPQPGFSTDPRETGPERVRIRFESDGHTSDFRAEWEAGELRITQNETGDD